MKPIYYFSLFLIINFGGLAFGSWLMDGGPTSTWYNSLNKAPWTPPGWVFGTAWSLIMLCFSWYLTRLFHTISTPNLWLLYGLHVLLNVSWNYIFFNQHLIHLGLLVLLALCVVVYYFFFKIKHHKITLTRYLLLPYMIWLIIALSLNTYIVLYN